ncbi:FtsX-like permease family protein [Isosphaeraceae bacterium EP7]
MFKYFLCWRYLQTRYIALASVVSVMLGVATMIVVNSVMAGFAEKMQTRLHGVLSDVIVESMDMDGFSDHEEVRARIDEVAGRKIKAMAATMETVGVMKFEIGGGQPISRPVQIIGIKPLERAGTGDFAEFLVDDKGKSIEPNFKVSEEFRMAHSPAGMVLMDEPDDELFANDLREQAREQVPDFGAIVGYALASIRPPGSDKDLIILPPGSKINLVFPASGNKPKPGYDSYPVLGYFKCGMSEYDSQHVYVPLEQLQYMRLLGDGKGNGTVNQIQIKAMPGADLDELSMTIQVALERLRPGYFRVSTWEQKQGPLLAAVAVEQGILNLLLFFIIAVAGFGILAIFSMIVVEKTRDIGVMKALGASTAGVRQIFLFYGLLLGAVGSGVGMVGGLLFVRYINPIEGLLSKVMGRKVFDDSIYYFNEIPTLVRYPTVLWIVGGAMFIAVAASVWPAQRAAKLHPVQALRFE